MGGENRHTAKTLGLTRYNACLDEVVCITSRMRKPNFSPKNRGRKQEGHPTREWVQDEPTRMVFDYDGRASRRINAESRKKPRPRVSGIAPRAAATQASGSILAIRVKVSM